MNFVNPKVLWAIPIVVPGVIWFLWWSWRKRNALVRLFVSERLLPQLLESYSPLRRKIKLALQVAAVLCLMLALARPQWGVVWEEANQQGRDILVAIDTSRSMLATDMAPDRLTRAKLAALDLMRLAKNDRLGLIAFAGASFLQCPLTLDDEAFRQSVEALDTSIIPQGGTAITEAIETAVTTFASEEGDNHRVLIIFTDGEDHETGGLVAAEDADNRRLKIFTVGVGTSAGELVRIADERGNPTYLKDDKGNVVKSRLNEDLLRQIATAAKGFYIPLREGNAMQVLYREGLEPLPTSNLSSTLVRQLNEQFHWPLGFAIAFLLIEALLPGAAKKRATAPIVTNKPTSPASATVGALILLLFAVSVDASPARALRDYKNGNFKDARNEYERLLEKKPDDPKLNYNAGAAAYRAGEFDAAAKGFANATKAQELDLQSLAYYNLGNANYRLGSAQPTPDKQMALWQEAVQNYDSALKLNPQDSDARFNRELVKKQLEELKKQQQQKEQQKNDNKDQNKDDKNQDQQQQQDKKENKDQNQQKQEQKDNQDSKSEEEKKKEEQQQQNQQQQQQQQDQKEGEQQDKPQAKNQNGEEQKNDQEKSEQQREAEQEARAAQLAQMTPKQAQQMLDAQKSEEKALIYRQYDESKKSRNRIIKDW